MYQGEGGSRLGSSSSETSSGCSFSDQKADKQADKQVSSANQRDWDQLMLKEKGCPTLANLLTPRGLDS
eukprot:m.59608 g.59608  ORF g.59608 m.59608 type:complete len:69 (-) comp9470_c0_seq1:18-224(-)